VQVVHTSFCIIFYNCYAASQPTVLSGVSRTTRLVRQPRNFCLFRGFLLAREPRNCSLDLITDISILFIYLDTIFHHILF
jgi:hypothetical protein